MKEAKEVKVGYSPKSSENQWLFSKLIKSLVSTDVQDSVKQKCR